MAKSLKRIFFRLISSASVLGILAVVLGIKILLTGRLREVIVLGEERYWVGGLSIIFGLYVLIVLLCEKTGSEKKDD
jgi:hypothetical protein